jgi:hypothetical protein
LLPNYFVAKIIIPVLSLDSAVTRRSVLIFKNFNWEYGKET